MTLIIGIKGKDGIVMASDGAATLGSMGQSTALQPTRKLSVIKEKLVIGVSGPVGLGQMLKGKAEAMWDAHALSGKKPHEGMQVLSQGFREYILPELQVARVASQTIGNAGLSSAICLTLVAVPIGGDLCLFQFDQQGSPEETTEEIPFASIGSGQPIADPFLGLLRRIFWSDHQPTVQEALFAAVWALDHAIKINPGGVAEPMQVITMIKNGANIEIKELSDAELSEHRTAVKAAEGAIAESLTHFKKSMAGDVGVKIPEPASESVTTVAPIATLTSTTK
jgi:20S proteasome alpha/beta subunit